MTHARGNIEKGMREIKMKDAQIGVVNCLRLHIHSEPSINSEIVCKIRYLTEVAIDVDKSTKDFYKIYTAVGAEGFCQKDLIIIK